MDIDKHIRYLESLTQNVNSKKEPGFCSAILHDGEVVHSLNHGLANMEHGVPLHADSVFYLASVSKQFTGACILKLVHDKELKLNQDVRELVKETAQFSDKITIQHLLNHTSGIADYFQFINCQLNISQSDYFENTEILKVISKYDGINFEPGERFSYSNSNYIILAQVVKKISGLSLAQYAKKHLFKPLNMTLSSFDDDRLKVVKNRVTAYRPESGKRKQYSVDLKNSCTVGDGGVLSSINDLVKWELNWAFPS